MKPAFVWRAIDLLSRGIHPWRFQIGPDGSHRVSTVENSQRLFVELLKLTAYEFSSKSDEKMLGACSACYSQIQ